MSVQSVRRPAVAGYFYTADAGRLRHDVEQLLGGPGPAEACLAVVVPHAGYLYSGRVAGRTFARVEVPERVLVLAVNHRGVGARVSTWSRGAWETPLGEVAVDDELVAAVARATPLVEDDRGAHSGEHSLEVQLPFLQVRRPDGLRLAPFLLATHELGELEELGHAIAAAVGEVGGPALIVASTDLTHYQPADVAERQDRLALERILAVDGPGLLRTVLGHDISMCGVAPTTAALVAARHLGARSAELVLYGNSGDVTGDRQSVVGYAGLVVR